MKILILRVSAIGDVVHTLPAIFLIKKVYPQAKISWVVQKKAAALLIDQPFLENVWVLPNKFLSYKNWKSTFKTIQQIRTNNWDAILDVQGIIKTSILATFCKGTKYGFDYKNSRLGLTSFLSNKHVKPIYKNIIQKNLSLTSAMLWHEKKSNYFTSPSINELKKTFTLQIPEQKKKIVNKWLKQNNIKNFIAIAPNTTWPSKQWPEENWEQLLELIKSNESLNNFFTLLIGKDFGQQAQNLAKKTTAGKNKRHICPKWDLITTCYLISKSNLLIAPDTGLLHIADFLAKKSIGIFGPTNTKKHGPFLTRENIKNSIQVKCPHYYQKIHGKIYPNDKNTRIQTNCMYKLSSEYLFEKILNVLRV